VEDLISRLTGRFRSSGIRNTTPVPFTGSRNLAMYADPSPLPVGERAYDAYGSVGTLFAIVSQIGNAFASTEWHLYRRTSVRDKKRRTEIVSHGFMDVWNMPNKFMTGRFFRESVQQHVDLVGEGIIVLGMVGKLVTEMWPVRPDRMRPVKSPTEFLTGWIYVGPDGQEVPLELEQVIQIKLPNPKDPYRGMGPVQSELADIDASVYSAEWNRNFFVNGARPGGIIEVDYRMSDEEFKGFVARWRQQHQGVANAHRVAVLENAKWKDTNFSMSDMQFVELRNLPRELIREAFAFPKPMLGTVDDVNRANSDAAKEIMAENHTVPRLRRWKDVINAFLLPRFANGATLELDYDDPTPINHEAADRERNSQAQSAKALVMAGYDPEAVADAMGLPRMEWVGVPSGGTGKEDDGERLEEDDEEAPAMPVPKKSMKPKMPSK
jgi:HK97 family phage portal protein